MRERYKRYVSKTKKNHICQCCGKIIKKGSVNIRYKNVFTGKRDYFCKECER